MSEPVKFRGLTHECDNPECHVRGFVATLARKIVEDAPERVLDDLIEYRDAVRDGERQERQRLASVLADDATVEVGARALAGEDGYDWDVTLLDGYARERWRRESRAVSAALSAHLAAPGPAGDPSGEEVVAEHTCCACYTHNGLPCCNAGHPPEQPDRIGARTVQRAWDRSPLLRSVKALRAPTPVRPVRDAGDEEGTS